VSAVGQGKRKIYDNGGFADVDIAAGDGACVIFLIVASSISARDKTQRRP
jgi:hypothetical protein